MTNKVGVGALPVHRTVVRSSFATPRFRDVLGPGSRRSTNSGNTRDALAKATPTPCPVSADAGLETDATHPEEFIETVDVWQLNQFRWPVMRVLTPGYVDHLELDRYLKRLLGTGRWRNVRAVHHADAHHRYQHLFDVYGQPT